MNKNNNRIEKDTKFMSLARVIAAIITLFPIGTLTLASFTGTTGMEIIQAEGVVDNILLRIREGWETVIYYSDNVFANFIMLIAGFIAIFLILPLMKKIPLWAEITIVATWTITLGVVWIYSSNLSPTEDSYRVTDAAICFAKENYGPLAEGQRYFRDYSYQLDRKSVV